MTPTVENVVSVYLAATPEEVAEGMEWYWQANMFAQSLAGDAWHRAAGVIAALSPMNDWDNNMDKADQMYRQNGDGSGCGLYRNVAKAQAIYFGEDALDVLGGNKVRSFFLNIVEPDGDHRAVIDRHAFDVAVGRVTSDKERTILARAGVYDRFANVYRDAASLAGICTSQMQAVTWVAWRNRKESGWS